MFTSRTNRFQEHWTDGLSWLSTTGFRLAETDQLASKRIYHGPVEEDHLSHSTDRDAAMIVCILD